MYMYSDTKELHNTAGYLMFRREPPHTTPGSAAYAEGNELHGDVQ